MQYFWKALGPRTSKLIFPIVKYTNTQIQIHKYSLWGSARNTQNMLYFLIAGGWRMSKNSIPKCSIPKYRNTDANTRTNTQIQLVAKCQINPKYAIFLNSWWFKDVKNDISKCSIHKYRNTVIVSMEQWNNRLLHSQWLSVTQVYWRSNVFIFFWVKNINLTIWRRLVSSLCTVSVNCTGEQTRLDWYIVATEQREKRNIWHIFSTFRGRCGSEVYFRLKNTTTANRNDIKKHEDGHVGGLWVRTGM